MMTAELVARTIQLILAPLVLVTVCTVVQNGLLSRYATVNDRLRRLTHERLEVLHDPEIIDALRADVLHTIDQQLPLLLIRHRLMQEAVLTLYSAILTLLFSMFAIAAATLSGALTMAMVALALFLMGAGILGVGIGLAMQEVRRSHRAIAYEVEHIAALKAARYPPHC